MYRTFTAFVVALGVSLLGGFAQANPLAPDQVQWRYDWSATPTAVQSNNSPTGVVTFTNEQPTYATGSSDIVATNLRVASTLPASAPNVLTTNGAYTLTLNLTMVEDGTPYSGTHTFSGKLSNTFSSEGANVKNVFNPGAGSSHEFILGSYLFTVTLDAYTPPGPPSATNPGSISAHVEVEIRPDLAQLPEPGTMVLGGMALTFFGGAAWRKRRQTVA